MALRDAYRIVTAPVDPGPVAYVIGRVLVVLAALMLVPAVADRNNGNAVAFLESAALTGLVGVLMTLTTRNRLNRALDIRQAIVLTLGIWVLVPAFGALPLMLGQPGLAPADAYFEAVSGVTTTGSTVIVGLDGLPPGMNLWRGLLNWVGGLGIAFVAMIFLPVMRVGGMQFFRTEGFDTFGKVLPRAADIAKALAQVYVILTAVVVLTYLAIGMTPLDAAVNGMATVATGGFSSSDASFGKYPGAAEYLGALFMLVAAMPYIRYVQLIQGNPRPLWHDPQVGAFLRWFTVGLLGVTLWRVMTTSAPLEPTFREALFNLSSIMTGTGFFSGSFTTWEGPALIVAFVMGFIGGCSGSSSGALTVFRVQLTLAAIKSQILLMQSPHRVAPIRYDGRKVAPDVVDALMLFVTGYVLLTGIITVLLSITGVDAYSALIATWASIGNIGYAWGPLVAPTGTLVDFPAAAKWLLVLAMLLGRLGLLTILVVVIPRFWRP